jgi:hypothetical protein
MDDKKLLFEVAVEFCVRRMKFLIEKEKLGSSFPDSIPADSTYHSVISFEVRCGPSPQRDPHSEKKGLDLARLSAPLSPLPPYLFCGRADPPWRRSP